MHFSGGTNHHLGNKRYRKMVEDRKIDYVHCKRLDKPMVALGIIQAWRAQVPMGRFLKMDDKTGLWNDVGDKKAREKTSQALREKAPQIREELEKERLARERRERGESTEEDDDDGEGGELEESDDPHHFKAARLAKNGVSSSHQSTHKKPSIVARDHSLGREYLNPDDNMSVEGFSWQEPVVRPEPHRTSYGSLPPPEQLHYYASSTPSWGPMESWGSMGGIPPPHMTSGPYYSSSSAGGGWGSARDHSLGAIPLQHATVNQAAYPATFDHHHRMGSAGPYWGPPVHHHSHGPPPPPYMEPPMYHTSGGSGGYHYPPPPPAAYPPLKTTSRPPPAPPAVAPKSPTYNVDLHVASQWSGRDQRDIALTLSGGSSGEERDTFVAAPPIRVASSSRNKVHPTKVKLLEEESKVQPKPDLIKRATSNQNETIDTKPGCHLDGHSVKRAALNRDSSHAANLLKAKYMPGLYPQPFDAKTEVESLSTNFEQSTLEATVPPSKPAQYTQQDRMMTLDMNALDLVIKPTLLRLSSRSTTLEALNIDFDDDPFASPITELDRDSVDDFYDSNTAASSLNMEAKLSRPSVLSTSQRLTTNDLFDIGTYGYTGLLPMVVACYDHVSDASCLLYVCGSQ
jgi:hypothetical protein